jgi:hypothetical protein
LSIIKEDTVPTEKAQEIGTSTPASKANQQPLESEQEALAIELFGIVMPGIPWDDNVVILQTIYRELAKYIHNNFERRPPAASQQN